MVFVSVLSENILPTVISLVGEKKAQNNSGIESVIIVSQFHRYCSLACTSNIVDALTFNAGFPLIPTAPVLRKNNHECFDMDCGVDPARVLAVRSEWFCAAGRLIIQALIASIAFCCSFKSAVGDLLPDSLFCQIKSGKLMC